MLILRSNLDRIIQEKKQFEKEEGVDGPNQHVFSISKGLLIDLVKKNYKPERITPSVEEGVCFVFKNRDQRMYLELYINF